MALFSKKKIDQPIKAVEKKEKKEVKEKLQVVSAEVNVGIPGIGGVKFTLKPRVTEKATTLSETNNVYVFDVPVEATKSAVSKAVSEIWKVHPTKIAIIRNQGKKKVTRGKKGRTSQSKKAYVYLKKGEKIEIV